MTANFIPESPEKVGSGDVSPLAKAQQRPVRGGIVRLNVGGKKFLTSWETIMHQANSMLASMFKGSFKCATDEDGFAFIDRDGERFGHVLNFLRCSSLPSFGEAWRYEEIMEEADFFGIDELRDLCARKIEELHEAKRKESAKSFSCRVTIIEPGSAIDGAAGSEAREAREREGFGYFTLDEDF
ncbi:unnamed protein product [Sphacelaria rigidula]